MTRRLAKVLYAVNFEWGDDCHISCKHSSGFPGNTAMCAPQMNFQKCFIKFIFDVKLLAAWDMISIAKSSS